jgi:hypothetical protein
MGPEVWMLLLYSLIEMSSGAPDKVWNQED